MVQLYDFGIDVQTYANRGKENAFPNLPTTKVEGV
ncbi:hypothetical protein LR68_04386 [Anoxybacillus sp. BCO1]|nr:hypothetical protein LR68_04386 [Anoxybacillus sp. BCO1]